MKVPALNGIATQRDTLEEARAMAEDLIRGYLQSPPQARRAQRATEANLRRMG